IDPEAREVSIAEGEIDALSAWDYGWPALSPPFGGGGGKKQAWIESEFERLLRFEVIYLALDMDDEGEAAARNGDWEGKFGLWFKSETYQYRSAQDDPAGRKFVHLAAGSVTEAA